MKYLSLKTHSDPILLLCLFLNGLFLTSCGSKKIISDSSGVTRDKVSGTVKERYSVILGVQKRDIVNEELYRFIDHWMGVPHRSGGMDEKGVDCSGFTRILTQEIYDYHLPRVARQMAEVVKRKYEDELREGDLVFFDFDGQKFSHVGIYLRNNKFVHASTSRGVIISDLKDPWYYKYFSRAGTIMPAID